MTRNPDRKEVTSNDAGQESGAPIGRWTRLRGFVLSKSKGKKARYPADRPNNDTTGNRMADRSLGVRTPSALKLKAEINGDEDESGGGTKSMRNLKKTRTFSNIFGTRKGRKIDVLAEEPHGNFEQDEMRIKSQPSADKNNNQNAPGEEPPASSQKLERLRRARASSANRTMIFKGDLPPSSPLSTKPLHSGETEMSKPRKSDVSEAEVEKFEKNKTNEQGNENLETSNVHGVEPESVSNSSNGSKSLNLSKTLLIMRLGSIVVDEAGTASRLLSSPFASPRRMHRRSSSLPGNLGHSIERSSSAPGMSGMRTKNDVSNDYESPWGVKDTTETDGETEVRNSSKSFRVTEFVQGLKARRQTQSSSNDLSLTDDSESQEGDGTAEPVDMFEDDFVDYSVRNMQKAQGQKTFRARKKKGIQNFT